MKYINLYPTVDKVKEQLIETPNVIGIEGSDKVFYFPASAGKETIPLDDGNGGITYDPYFYQMSQFQGPHGGIFAVFDFTGKNQRIGGTTLYSELDTLYLDGEVFDIEDLIITVGGGSGSGSGSGSYGGASGIAMPSSITGVHTIEYCTTSSPAAQVIDKGWFSDCTGLISICIPRDHSFTTDGFINTSIEHFYCNCHQYSSLNGEDSLFSIFPNLTLLYLAQNTSKEGLTVKNDFTLNTLIVGNYWKDNGLDFRHLTINQIFSFSRSFNLIKKVLYEGTNKPWFILNGAELPTEYVEPGIGDVFTTKFVCIHPSVSFPGTADECLALYTPENIKRYSHASSTNIDVLCTNAWVHYHKDTSGNWSGTITAL